jgi:2'-5' RNA ligase
MENIPGALMRPNKYFIAIVLPEPLATSVMELKSRFRDDYKSKASLNSPAHITLHMPFEWNADKEEQLVATFNKFSIDPFEIQLNNFGCFEPRVIFIDVVKDRKLEECYQKLTAFAKTELRLFNSQYRDQPFHPHVTLAFRDLKKPQFEMAWNEFKFKTYSRSFECRKLTLLRHDGKIWREFS